MRLSARNQFPGKVGKIVPGAINSEVEIEIAPGIVITAIITKAAVEQLGLKVGAKAYAIIKASNVMVGVD